MMQITAAQMEEIESCLDKERVVNAIKAIRAATGLGLKESKAEVDHYRDHGVWFSLYVTEPPTPLFQKWLKWFKCYRDK